MNAFNDPVGAVLILLALTVATALLFTLLCAATSICVRVEHWWLNRKVIGSLVDEPSPKCRTIEDYWRYDFERQLPNFLRPHVE